MTEKTCTKCGGTLALEAFPKNRRRPDGRGPWCKGCQRTGIAKWRGKKLSTYLSAYFRERYERLRQLKTRPCVDCSQQFLWFVMDFDHRDPATKTDTVALMVGRSIAWSRVLDEIAKCDLVCVCCHRLRTHGKGSAPKTKAAVAIRAAKQAPCFDCWETFEPCQMDFDHVSGVKVAPVSRMRTSSLDKVLAEIDKCEVVCANCHRVRTFNRKDMPRFERLAG